MPFQDTSAPLGDLIQVGQIWVACDDVEAEATRGGATAGEPAALPERRTVIAVGVFPDGAAGTMSPRALIAAGDGAGDSLAPAAVGGCGATVPAGADEDASGLVVDGGVTVAAADCPGVGASTAGDGGAVAAPEAGRDAGAAT